MTAHFSTEHLPEHMDKRHRASGISEEVFAAIGIALAIIGLAGAAPRVLDTIAVIVLGATFLCERWTVAGAHEGFDVRRPAERALTAESIAGWAGVVLGILSLLRVAPTVLAPIAVIVFGAGLVFGVTMGWRTERVIAGVATMVLGILALIQLDPRRLTLIGLMVVGVALLFTGPMVASRLHHAVKKAERAVS
jgi:hypothetical protein